MGIKLQKDKYNQKGENLSERIVVLVSKKDFYRLMEIKAKEKKRLGVDEIDLSEFMRALTKDQIHRYHRTDNELFEQ